MTTYRFEKPPVSLSGEEAPLMYQHAEDGCNKLTTVKEVMDDQLSRVVRVRVPYRELLNPTYLQAGLPIYVEVSRAVLPRGYRVLQTYNDPATKCLVAVVQHASFAVVPEYADIPWFNEGGRWYAAYYEPQASLATPEDLAARKLWARGVDKAALERDKTVTAESADGGKTWRDRPSQL